MVLEESLIIAGIGLAGAVIGGIASFYAQRWFFNRTLKKQIIEEVYHPLLDDLEFNIKNFVNNLEYTTHSLHVWSGLRQTSKYRHIKNGLRTKVFNFYETELNNFDKKIIVCNNLIEQTINEEFIEPTKEKGEKLNFYPLGDRQFVNSILRFDTERGAYLGSLPPPILPRLDLNDERIGHIKGYFPIKEDFIIHMTEKIKNNPIVIETKQKRIELLNEIKDLQAEIEKEAQL